MGTENLLMCRTQACQPPRFADADADVDFAGLRARNVAGWKKRDAASSLQVPKRLLAVRGQRGAHGSASLFAFLPEGRSGPTLNFSGGLFRVSGVPGPWTPPARPPSRLDAGGPETALHTPSQLGRAERSAAPARVVRGGETRAPRQEGLGHPAPAQPWAREAAAGA